MRLPLSPRLKLCCGFVAPGDTVADIGCDHGYLGIYLLANGIAREVIAADINEMPLQSAMRNAKKFGVADKMHFYLSDGARRIPREFDTLVCAGMGADTIISILTAAPWLQSPRYRLVLQCQTRTPLLRQFLSESGWRIHEESVVRDGRFLYTVMEAVWQPGRALTPGEWCFPPALLENPGEASAEYYRRTLKKLENVAAGQGEQAAPALLQAIAELRALPASPGLGWLKEENQ